MKKIIINEQTFTFFTKRKTAPCCNGTGTYQTNYGIDECGYCLGSGDFKDAFELCINGSGVGNLYVFSKYLSHKDFIKAQELKKRNEQND